MQNLSTSFSKSLHSPIASIWDKWLRLFGFALYSTKKNDISHVKILYKALIIQ